VRSLPTTLFFAALAAIMPASSSFAQSTRTSPDLDPSRLVADQLASLRSDMVAPGPNQDVRDAAARRLLSIGTAEARNAVRAALLDPANTAARLAAVRAVAEDLPPDPEFVDVLFVLLSPDLPKPITDAAAAALGNYKLEPDVSRRLVDLSTPLKPEAQRLIAIRALSSQIEKRAAEQLVLLTQDPSPVVAAAATDAVRTFASSPLDSPTDWWKTQSDHTDERFRLETLAARSAKSESEVRRGEETYQELRRSVLATITSAPREQRGAVLLVSLQSKREAVRLIAVTQAYEFATTGDLPDDARPAIRDLIADAKPEIRLVAARTIAVLNDGEAFADIARQVAVESDARVRAELARTLGPMGNLDGLPLLRWLLDDSSTPVVTAAAGSIARLAPLAAQQDPASAAELAIRLQAVLQTKTGADARLRESLLEALVPLKQRSMLATFKSILTANPRVSETSRRLAAAGLGAIGEPETAAILVEAMRDLDGSAAVRGEAARAIGMVSTTFENAEAIYRAMARETDPGVAAIEWTTIKSLLSKAPREQLERWPELPLIANDDSRRLDVDRALLDLAVAAKHFDLQTFYQQRIGDTLMRMGDAAEAKQDVATARQRFSDATTQYEAALKLTREKGGPSMRVDTLVTNMVRSMLRARNYADAVKFAANELSAPNGSRFQDIVGPEFKLEAERLADPNRANQLDDALNLVKEAMAMSPQLAPMYRGHLIEVQRGVESRQQEKNELAYPDFWQALAMVP
jgi:HEAT repeat protein